MTRRMIYVENLTPESGWVQGKRIRKDMEFVEQQLATQGLFQVEQRIKFFQCEEYDWAIVIAESPESARRFQELAHGKEIQFNNKDPIVTVEALLWTDEEFLNSVGNDSYDRARRTLNGLWRNK